MSATPPPMPTVSYAQTATSTTSAPKVVFIVLIWLAWAILTVVADFMAFMMFAFADAPGANKAAQLMIGPVFAWFAIAFIAGALLLAFRRWWMVVLAFILAASPPFVVFAGYNLLDGAGRTQAPPSFVPPPVDATVPAAGFKPPQATTQPDFQKRLDAINAEIRSGTQPSDTER